MIIYDLFLFNLPLATIPAIIIAAISANSSSTSLSATSIFGARHFHSRRICYTKNRRWKPAPENGVDLWRRILQHCVCHGYNTSGHQYFIHVDRQLQAYSYRRGGHTGKQRVTQNRCVNLIIYKTTCRYYAETDLSLYLSQLGLGYQSNLLLEYPVSTLASTQIEYIF